MTTSSEKAIRFIVVGGPDFSRKEKAWITPEELVSRYQLNKNECVLTNVNDVFQIPESTFRGKTVLGVRITGAYGRIVKITFGDGYHSVCPCCGDVPFQCPSCDGRGRDHTVARSNKEQEDWTVGEIIQCSACKQKFKMIKQASEWYDFEDQVWEEIT